MIRNKRFSVWPIFTRHYRGLVPAGRRFLQAKTIAYLFALPVAVGTLTVLLGTKIQQLDPAIAGLGVLAGAFLAGFVLLTDLRVKIRESESHRVQLGRLIGRTAATTMYLMVLSLAALMLIIVGGVLSASLPSSLAVVEHIISGTSVAALVHIGTTGMTFLRRLFSVYTQMFSGDFAPELRAIEPETSDHQVRHRREA